MTRWLSLAALAVLELSPPEMVACAAGAGCSYPGLRLIPATDNEPSWPVLGATTMVRELEQRLADSGVRVLDIEIFRLRPETEVASYLPALETGARLGATHVLVANNDSDEARLTERLATICDLGAPLGLTFDLEPMPWTEVKTLQQGTRLAIGSGKSNAGVLIDPIHFDRGGNVPADIAAVPPQCCITRSCATRRRSVRAICRRCSTRRAPSASCPATGASTSTGILRALPSTLPLAVEIPLRTLAKTVPAVERARRIRAKTEALRATL